MKRNIFLLVLLMLAIFIAGCSPEEDLEEDTVEQEEAEKDDEPVQDEVDHQEDIDDVERPEVGELALDLVYTNEDGEEVYLKNLSGEDVSLEDYRGKVVFINFWATWCQYCDIEMPDLNRFNHENEDVVVLAIDVMEEQSVVENYINEGGYDFEVALDIEGEVSAKYLVSGLPTTYIIDEEGILLGAVPGMMEYEQMEEILQNTREE